MSRPVGSDVMAVAPPPDLAGYAEQLIRGRRAIRSFRPDPVPEETLRAVFGLAGASPSNSNAQPWRVEVVSGQARDELAAALQAAQRTGTQTVDFPYSEDIYLPVHRRRRAAFGAALYGTLGIGLDDHAARAAYDAESLEFYGAPHVALLFAPETGEDRLAADVGMYGQTLLLAMTAYGVASVPQGLLSFYADTIRATLGVADGKLLFGISFGYADPAAAVNRMTMSREPLSETTRFHS